MTEAVSITSLNVLSEYRRKITKTTKNVVADAMARQLIALAILRNGLSLIFSFSNESLL